MFAPVLYLGVWFGYLSKKPGSLLVFSALFFTSYVAFSQNFQFIYREIHQLFQIVLIVFLFLLVLKRRRFLVVSVIPFVFFGFIFISLIFSGLDADAIQQVINYLVCISVVFFLYTSVSGSVEIESLMQFLAKLCVVSAFLGCVEGLFSGFERVEVTSANPNYYALFLGVGFCVVWERFHGWRKWLFSAFIVSAIIFSGSRSVLLFPLVAMVWSVYRTRSYEAKLGTATVLAVALIMLLQSGVTRLSDSDAINASDAERLGFAKIAFSMAEDKPFTGVGWGRFISEFSDYSRFVDRFYISGSVVDLASHERRVTHNDFLRILAELGWIAFFMSLVCVLYGFYLCWKQRNSDFGYIFPLWLGLIFFSLTHNNMNTAFFWFLFLFPFVVFGRRGLWQYGKFN